MSDIKDPNRYINSDGDCLICTETFGSHDHKACADDYDNREGKHNERPR